MGLQKERVRFATDLIESKNIKGVEQLLLELNQLRGEVKDLEEGHRRQSILKDMYQTKFEQEYLENHREEM